MAKRLSSKRAVAFDTEFLWERTYTPQLGLIQIADAEESWAVDPVKLSADQMRPLLDILVDDDILKIVHAADQDQICLQTTYDIVAAPVLDTATAAALLGMGEQIGLSKLLYRLLKVEIKKSYSRTNWLKRPLPAAMLQYAIEDVSYLPRAAEVLSERLGDAGRIDWALELSARYGRFAKAHFDPAAVARKLAESRRLDATTFSVLRELIGWREQEASRANVPRKWIAEDKILVKLATARPTAAKPLSDFRGLGGVKRPAAAARVLKAIRKGIDTKPANYSLPKRKKQATQTESATLIVLRCFLNTLAAERKVPLKLMLDTDNMVGLLRQKFEDVDSLGASGIVDPRAVELIGEDLIAILNGRRGLRIANGRAVLDED